MTETRPFARALDTLKTAGLRPTRQRMALAKLLFDHGDRHVTAEQLYEQTVAAEMRVSLATVYNTLHQFTAAGLLREVVVESGRAYFDTNTGDHHHFYHPATGQLRDIPSTGVAVTGLPLAPEGTRVERVDVVVRLGAAGKSA